MFFAVAHAAPLGWSQGCEGAHHVWLGLQLAEPGVVVQDLSKVCLPVYFNEPTSALQKIAEELEYSHLLDQVRAVSISYSNRLVDILSPAELLLSFSHSSVLGSTVLWLAESCLGLAARVWGVPSSQSMYGLICPVMQSALSSLNS